MGYLTENEWEILQLRKMEDCLKLVRKSRTDFLEAVMKCFDEEDVLALEDQALEMFTKNTDEDKIRIIQNLIVYYEDVFNMIEYAEDLETLAEKETVEQLISGLQKCVYHAVMKEILQEDYEKGIIDIIHGYV